MSKLALTDANGKAFEKTLAEIFDMSESIGEVNDVQVDNFVPELVDSKGEKFDPLSIKDAKDKNIVAIDVLFEATHSGQNDNYFVYHSDSMEEDTNSWLHPYQKPFIKNHNSDSEPLGRVKEAYFARSEIQPSRDCINVVFRITDEEAIPKFMDGRYKTMSIGGSPSEVSCSICGKKILKDGVFKFCGHWRGDNYAGQKAFWNAKNITYNEGSVVNHPADKWAILKRITVITSEDANTEDSTNKEGESKVNPEDELILKEMNALVVEDSTKIAEEKPEEIKVKDEVKEGVAVEDQTKDKEITDLKAEVQRLADENKELKDTVATKDVAYETLGTEKTSLEDSEKILRSQSIQIAVLNKKLLAKRVTDFEMFSNKLEDSGVDERNAELMKMTAKELKDLNDSVSFKTVVVDRVVPVANPTLANEDGTVLDKNDQDENTVSDLTKFKNLEDEVISSLTSRY